MKKLFNPKFYYLAMGFASALFLLILFTSVFFVDSKLLPEAAPDGGDYPQGYMIVSPPIPDDLNFAGEKVPLDNFEVYERMDREFLSNTYWHSFTLLGIKRANRWFPVIESILKKNGIPDDFKYVALIESHLTNAVSPAGAVGFWQFIESAAKENGLEVNDEVDERYHVVKSTEAACRYIRNAYNRFGSWTLVAASYNMGMTGVAKQLERQKTNNYYNLVINDETSRYIGRILAVKSILNAPAKYGYHLNPNELYQPFRTYDDEITAPVADLADYAISKGINYKILKLYNPWLRDIKIEKNKGRTYTVQLPVKGSINIISGSH